MSRCMFYTKKVNKDLNTQTEICKALIECKCNNCNFILTKEAYEKKEEKVRKWYEKYGK